MRKISLPIAMVVIVLIAGCDSSSNSSAGGNDGMPVMGTLDDIVSRPSNSQPLDDGLDQVSADLLNLLGEANSAPVALDDNETVATFITKQGLNR